MVQLASKVKEMQLNILEKRRLEKLVVSHQVEEKPTVTTDVHSKKLVELKNKLKTYEFENNKLKLLC